MNVSHMLVEKRHKTESELQAQAQNLSAC